MVNSLGWETLQDRRKMQRLTMLFKIKYNLVEIPEVESSVWSNDSRTRGSQRLFVPYTCVTVYKMSFFPSTIQDWNKLPSSITDMQSSLHPQRNKPTVVYSFNCKKWNLLLYILLRGDRLVLTSPWSKLHSSYGFLTCIRKMMMKMNYI